VLAQLIARRNISEALTKPLIVVAVILLSAYLGRGASLSTVMLLVVLIGGLALIRLPQLGLVALMITALIIPFSIGTGTQSSLNGAILLIPLLLAVWVFDMIRRRSVKLAPSPANLPLFALALSATVSLLAGNLTWSYFARQASLQSQVGGWAVFVFSVGAFLLAGNQIRDLRWLKILTVIFLALGAITVVIRTFPTSMVPVTLVVREVQSESLFWVWLVALAGGQAMFNRSLTPPVRAALAVLAIATLAQGFFLFRAWISGWFPPFVVLFVLVWLRSWRLGLVIAVIGMIGILFFRPDFLPSVTGLKQYSTDTRLAAWQILFSDIIPISPVIGLGPANYYFYTPLFPILGYYVSFNSHSQYVDLLAQTGIVGLVIFGWVIFSMGSLGWNLRKSVQEGFARGYVHAGLAGLVGMVVAGWFGDWVLPFVYNVGLAGFRASVLGWLFLGGLVAVEEVTKSAEHRQALD
jgi:hypothetical protein